MDKGSVIEKDRFATLYVASQELVGVREVKLPPTHPRFDRLSMAAKTAFALCGYGRVINQATIKQESQDG